MLGLCVCVTAPSLTTYLTRWCRAKWPSFSQWNITGCDRAPNAFQGNVPTKMVQFRAIMGMSILIFQKILRQCMKTLRKTSMKVLNQNLTLSVLREEVPSPPIMRIPIVLLYKIQSECTQPLRKTCIMKMLNETSYFSKISRQYILRQLIVDFSIYVIISFQ